MSVQTQKKEAWMSKVEQIAADVCATANCFLYDVEFVPAGQRTLSVFIDSEKEGGVDIEDCTNVSRGLNEIMDADENLIPGGAYQLEVSTPGIERKLKMPWHFQKAVGKKIWVRVGRALETMGVTDAKYKNAKQVEEVLTSADENSITFVVGEATIRIPLAEIEKAKVVFVDPKAKDQVSKNPKNKNKKK